MATERPHDDLHDRSPLALDLPAHVASPGVARAWLITIADATALPDELVTDATLVLSELVTNAVIHAATDVHVYIELHDASGIHLEVGDATHAIPQVQPAAPEKEGGEGMRIVERLAAAWGVRQVGDGKVVWADLAAVA